MEEIRKKALEIYNTRKKKILQIEFQKNKVQLSKEEQEMRIKEIVKKLLDIFEVSNQRYEQMVSRILIKSTACAVVFEKDRRLCLCDEINGFEELVSAMQELNRMKILEDEYTKISKIFSSFPNYSIDFIEGSSSYLIIEMNRPTICKK